ncbi:MAG: hypothetical protein QXJ04_01625 [Acidilobaceae archaeon]
MTSILEVDMRPGGSCGDSPSAALSRLASRVEAEKPDTVRVRLDPSLVSPGALKVILSQRGYEAIETIKNNDRDVVIVFSRRK